MPHDFFGMQVQVVFMHQIKDSGKLSKTFFKWWSYLY